MFKELLHDIVAKDIDHQSIRIDHDLFKDALSVVTVRSGDLLLKESGPLLVTGKFNHTTKHILRNLLANRGSILDGVGLL